MPTQATDARPKIMRGCAGGPRATFAKRFWPVARKGARLGGKKRGAASALAGRGRSREGLHRASSLRPRCEAPSDYAGLCRATLSFVGQQGCCSRDCMYRTWRYRAALLQLKQWRNCRAMCVGHAQLCNCAAARCHVRLPAAVDSLGAHWGPDDSMLRPCILHSTQQVAGFAPARSPVVLQRGPVCELHYWSCLSAAQQVSSSTTAATQALSICSGVIRWRRVQRAP